MIEPRRSTTPVEVERVRSGRARRRKDRVAVEEPLEIRVEVPGRPAPRTLPVSVTMRTPGDDFDLVAGFLFAEGVVTGRDQIAELTYCRDGEPQEYNVIVARLREGATLDPVRLQRNFLASSSCGVCGKASLEAVELRGCTPLPEEGLRVDAGVLPGLPGALVEDQDAFRRTGGVHAAGLFSAEGDLRTLREDVGRHNAVDKAVGHEVLGGRVPLDDAVLVVSGRASFEIVQKAVVAGIPAVAAVGAPSSLAVELARRFGMTLVGFLRDDGFNVYAGGHRVEGPSG